MWLNTYSCGTEILTHCSFNRNLLQIRENIYINFKLGTTSVSIFCIVILFLSTVESYIIKWCLNYIWSMIIGEFMNLLDILHALKCSAILFLLFSKPASEVIFYFLMCFNLFSITALVLYSVRNVLCSFHFSKMRIRCYFGAFLCLYSSRRKLITRYLITW